MVKKIFIEATREAWGAVSIYMRLISTKAFTTRLHILTGTLVTFQECHGIANHWLAIVLLCFIQQLVQSQNKENIKAPPHWPLLREIH